MSSKKKDYEIPERAYPPCGGKCVPNFRFACDNNKNPVRLTPIENKSGEWHHEQAVLHYPHGSNFAYAGNQIKKSAEPTSNLITIQAKL